MPRSKETATESAFLNVSPSQFMALSDSKANGLLQAQSAIRRQQAWHAFFGIFFWDRYLSGIARCVHLPGHARVSQTRRDGPRHPRPDCDQADHRQPDIEAVVKTCRSVHIRKTVAAAHHHEPAANR